MLKKHTFWIKAAIALQFLTAAFHSLSFLGKPVAGNETERQLIDLMTTYQMDMGNGFTATMHDLYTSMSACFALLLLFGGVLNWFMLRQKAELHIWKGLIHIELVIFGVCFLVMAFFTFLPPILCTGLIFSSLMMARFTFPLKKHIVTG